MGSTRLARYILLLSVMSGFPAAAVAVEDQPKLWVEAGLRYRIIRPLRLMFDQHVRFEKNATEIMPELALSWRPLGILYFDAGYRFIAQHTEDEFGKPNWMKFHRFFLDARLRLRFSKIRLLYRLRFQEEFGWISDVLDSEQSIRNKLEAQLKTGTGFDPFLSTELFNRLDDSRRNWFKWRLAAGLDVFLESHKLTFFYRLEIYLFDDSLGDVTVEKGDRNHILGLGYHYRF